MTKVIAFANQKGGVAKTTSAVALAQSLAMEGKRILFLDLDPQENAYLIVLKQRLCKLPLWMSLEQLFMTKMVNLKLKA